MKPSSSMQVAPKELIPKPRLTAWNNHPCNQDHRLCREPGSRNGSSFFAGAHRYRRECFPFLSCSNISSAFSVVCCDKEYTSSGLDRVSNPCNTNIKTIHRSYHGRIYAGMANHISVRIVEPDKIETFVYDGFTYFVRYFSAFHPGALFERNNVGW